MVLLLDAVQSLLSPLFTQKSPVPGIPKWQVLAFQNPAFESGSPPGSKSTASQESGGRGPLEGSPGCPTMRKRRKHAEWSQQGQEKRTQLRQGQEGDSPGRDTQSDLFSPVRDDTVRPPCTQALTRDVSSHQALHAPISLSIQLSLHELLTLHPPNPESFQMVLPSQLHTTPPQHLAKADTRVCRSWRSMPISPCCSLCSCTRGLCSILPHSTWNQTLDNTEYQLRLVTDLGKHWQASNSG